MQKLKMIFVGGVFVAITVLSVASLCFSDDAQPAPDATGDAVMSNISSTAPDGLGSYSVAPAPLSPQSIPPAEE